MRIIQLSDPHLVASDSSMIRGSFPDVNYQKALRIAFSYEPDLILITGDLCNDESWGDYTRIKKSLEEISTSTTIAVTPVAIPAIIPPAAKALPTPIAAPAPGT